MSETFYDILEIPRRATDLEIKNAFKKKALQFHPDKYKHNSQKQIEENDEKCKKIVMAFQTLITPSLKDIYHNHGEEKLKAYVKSVNDDESIYRDIERLYPKVLVTKQINNNFVSYVGEVLNFRRGEHQKTYNIVRYSNNFLGYTFENEVPVTSTETIDLFLPKRNTADDHFVVYKETDDIVSVLYKNIMIHNFENGTIIHFHYPFYLDPKYELLDHKCNKNDAEKPWTNHNKLTYGNKYLFQHDDKIRLGIPLYYTDHENNIIYDIRKKNNIVLCTVVSPSIYPGTLLRKGIKLYDIKPSQVIDVDSQTLKNLKLVSPKKLYSLEYFLNENLLATNEEKIEIYLNTRFHVFTENDKPEYQDIYDIKIFEIYKNIRCVIFSSFVIKLQQATNDMNRSDVHASSSRTEYIHTIDVDTAIQTNELNKIMNLDLRQIVKTIYERKNKLYLTILVPKQYKISI